MCGTQRFAGLLLAASLAGCAGFGAAPRSPIAQLDNQVDELAQLFSADAVARCLNNPIVPDIGDAHRQCRDRIIQAALPAIDLRYADFEIGMFDANRYGNFGATLAQLGLTTAATVSGGPAARLLAAIATGVTGGREAFSREVLAERTVVALQTAMQARRNEVARRLRTGLTLTAVQYPLGVALSDLYGYYRAGTLVGAVVGLGEAAGEEARTARSRLDETIGLAPLRAAVPLPSPPPAALPPPPIRRPLVPVTRPEEQLRVNACLQGMLATPAGQDRLRQEIDREVAAQTLRPGVRPFSFVANPGFQAQRMSVGRTLCPMPASPPVPGGG